MKKTAAIAVCIFMCLLLSGALKKPAKQQKAPKVNSAILAKELKAANNTIEELQAQNVSLSAKTVLLENDIKKLKKDKESSALFLGVVSLVSFVLAVFLIAGFISKQAEVINARKKAASGGGSQRHFEDIEAHVLDDWHNIWYHPEKINRELYEDLSNHFPELHAKIEKWKADISRRGIFTGHLISLLSTKFPDVQGSDSIYMLALEGSEPFIEENEISMGVSVCAHLKNGVEASSKMMKAYYDEAMSQFRGEFKEVGELTNQIAVLKDEIDIDIRKIKHFRKIQGACKFLNTPN
jgi:hypothetical protein